VDGSKGFARASDDVFPGSRASHGDAKRCAEGAPSVPDGGGVPEGGARPPLLRMRRKSIPVRVGDVVIGGAAPIAVQTMTKTDTRDVRATLNQIAELKEAGCEIVRPAVPDHHAAEALKAIVAGSPLPIIADIHYDHRLALMALEAGVHGLRLNPGNIPDREKVERVVRAAKEREVPFRIGVNAGSLPEEVHRNLREQQAVDRDDRRRTAERMVEVALGHCKILEELDYGAGHIKVSLKATDVWTNVMANRLFAEARAYPIHLGVTESGPVQAGSIRSAVGLGILLGEGIGDTIRVSLATDDPTEEIRAGYEVLKALDLRNESASLVACPTCGRLEYDMIPAVRAVEAHIARLKVPITVAVMGCVVNGPAEARHADIGVTGGRGKGVIFKRGKHWRTVAQAELLPVLLTEIDAMAAERGRGEPA
jgi:(E)-4-hydroxy-3-methylbut-2-enyl-diphosphate synthase